MTSTLPPRHLAVAPDAPTSADEFLASLTDDVAASGLVDLPNYRTLTVPDVQLPDRTLDWKSRHDPASLGYGLRQLLAASTPIQDHVLPMGPIMDQGAEGACTGFGAAAASNVLEAIDGGTEWLAAADADELYERAKDIDEWPGDSYAGSSVLAVMKAGQERKLWDGYVWDFGTADIVQSILSGRPVVMGVPILSGMFDTDGDGVWSVTGSATGQGHCLPAVGVLTSVAGRPGPWIVVQNSWGTSWGDGGLGYVHHKDLARLLRGVGEAAVPVAPQ